MSRRTLAIVLAAVALAAAVAVGVLARRDRDEARLRRELRNLAALVEKRGPESALAAARRARDVAALFAREARIDLPEAPFAPGDRSDLAAAVFHARASVDRLSIRIHDIAVRLEPDRNRAHMEFSATATAASAHGSDRAHRAFELDWVREPDGWRIAAVRAARVLRPIPPTDGPPR